MIEVGDKVRLTGPLWDHYLMVDTHVGAIRTVRAVDTDDTVTLAETGHMGFLGSASGFGVAPLPKRTRILVQAGVYLDGEHLLRVWPVLDDERDPDDMILGNISYGAQMILIEFDLATGEETIEDVTQWVYRNLFVSIVAGQVGKILARYRAS
jgi:hypothetical protein